MEALLKELMNRGFLIYRYEKNPPFSSARPKFVLAKVSTPFDNSTTIPSENGTRPYFTSFEEALDEAKKLIDWKDKEIVKEAIVNLEPRLWTAQLMYRHALGRHHQDLGEIDNLSYVEAVEAAKKLAKAYITEYLEEDDIDGWDVRIRPCNL